VIRSVSVSSSCQKLFLLAMAGLRSSALRSEIAFVRFSIFWASSGGTFCQSSSMRLASSRSFVLILSSRRKALKYWPGLRKTSPDSSSASLPSSAAAADRHCVVDSDRRSVDCWVAVAWRLGSLLLGRAQSRRMLAGEAMPEC
jgi:hypothetical protein